MAPDPRWLEILKASGWQTTAVAGACLTFLLVIRWAWVPTPDDWIILLTVFVLFLSAFLTLASFVSAFLKFVPIRAWIVHLWRVHSAKRDVEKYIPHMTPIERKIISYLLANNQKTFTAASDGGHAVTLISRGIVRRALIPGQIFLADDMPMGIPDHIWKVLQKHKSQFPYSSPAGEAAPWRNDWMS